MEIPRISWSGSFNAAAVECGLTGKDVLAIEGEQHFGTWVWMRRGDRIECGNGRTCCSIDISDIHPFGISE